MKKRILREQKEMITILFFLYKSVFRPSGFRDFIFCFYLFALTRLKGVLTSTCSHEKRQAAIYFIGLPIERR